MELATYIFQISFLAFILHTAPQIRRITKHEDFFIFGMRADFVPVNAAGIATNNLRDVLQGQGFGVDAKVFIELGIHLVLG